MDGKNHMDVVAMERVHAMRKGKKKRRGRKRKNPRAVAMYERAMGEPYR